MSENNPTTPPSPDDKPTAAELEAAKVMRPLEELPSNFGVKGSPRMLAELPALTAFSPADQSTIRAAARNASPEGLQDAIQAFLQERSTAFRIMAGPGENATAVEREAVEQLNEMRLLGERSRLAAELEEVREARIERDESGQQVAIPVYRHEGAQRTWREARINEINHAIALKAGTEGEAGLHRAAREEALQRRQMAAQIEDQREINRRAHKQAREKRLDEAAAVRAKHL